MIRQFDVLPSPIRGGREDRPYVVSLQHAHLDNLRTRIVVPLVVERAIKPGTRLTPPVIVLGKTLYLSPTEIVTLSTSHLRTPVANLENYRRQIIEAIDLAFLGI